MITKTIPNEITISKFNFFYGNYLIKTKEKNYSLKSTSMALGDYIQVAKDNKRRIKMRKT